MNHEILRPPPAAVTRPSTSSTFTMYSPSSPKAMTLSGLTLDSPRQDPPAVQFHIAGISLGGMIAQELGLMLPPGTISSMSLISTAALLENTLSFSENVSNKISLLRPRTVESSVRDTAKVLFPTSWLFAPDDNRLPEVGGGVKPPMTDTMVSTETKTPAMAPAPVVRTGPRKLVKKSSMMAMRAAMPERIDEKEGIDFGAAIGVVAPSPERKTEAPMTMPSTPADTTADTTAPQEYLRFENRYQRYVAEEMHRRLDKQRFSMFGFVLQLVAANGHRKSAEQLAELADRVGRERIMVMHGSADAFVTAPHGRKLITMLEPAVGLVVPRMGHAPIFERWEWFNWMLEGRVAVGEKMDGRLWDW
jgi:pimeloyl-ACP methyl ester carboxylesterase